MAVLARGETVIEYARHVFRRDADAIVRHGDFDLVDVAGDAHDDLFIVGPTFIARLFGVAHEVHAVRRDSTSGSSAERSAW